MEEIGDKIMKGRNLRQSTLKTYLFNLNKLHKKMFENKDLKDLDFLLKTDDVIDTLADLKISTQKTYLASLVVALDSMKEKKYDKALEKYREIMIDNIKSYNDEVKEQKKSETQDVNWTSMKSLKKVISNYRKELIDKGIFKKEEPDLTRKDKDLLQKWLVGSLYVIDNDNPPLRLENYVPLEIISLKDYNKLSDKELEGNNYLVNVSRNKKFFSFGEYKTSKTYGVKKIDVGSKLNSVLNLYLRTHSNKYLILNNRDEAMSPNGLSKYITKVFEPSGKKITANLMRHIYISEFMTGPSIKEKEELADKMLHSSSASTQELYAKH